MSNKSVAPLRDTTNHPRPDVVTSEQHASVTTTTAPTDSRAKRIKMTSITKELQCAITQELPYEPVIARDGCVYEKSAVEKHIRSYAGEDRVSSPTTSLPMGVELLPAPWIKKHIESLLDRGLVEGSLARAWNAKKALHDAKRILFQRALAGHADAMYNLAVKYHRGCDNSGIPIDHRLALEWSVKAHRAGSPEGTAFVGYLHHRGHGVTKDATLATLYYGMAATRGSDYAAFQLGRVFADVPKKEESTSSSGPAAVSREEAIRWLKVCLDPQRRSKQLSQEMEDEARQMLDDLKAK